MQSNLNPMDLVTGGLLACAEAATVGMPFEVWKTHMGTYRRNTTSTNTLTLVYTAL